MRRIGIVLAVAILVLGGCAATPAGPRALTTEEAQRLAVARFRNVDVGIREIVMTVPGAEGVELTGWVDFARHLGYASVIDLDSQAPLGLLRWDLDSVAVHDPVASTLPVPTDGWSVSPVDVTSSLGNAIIVVLSLGSDRPDNPQLLQQTDARWLRTDSVGSVEVTVFAGPSADAVATAAPPVDRELTRFWVDDTGLLLRFEARTSSNSEDWIVLDLGPAAEPDLGSVEGVDGDTS